METKISTLSGKPHQMSAFISGEINGSPHGVQALTICYAY